MLMSRKRQLIFVAIYMGVLTIWYTSKEHVNHASLYISNHHPLLQSLHLTLSLPRNTTYRRTIVRSYINNLHSQIAAQQQQDEDVVRLELEDVYAARRQRVHDVCKLQSGPELRIQTLRQQVSVLQDPPVLYCAIPKAGSTFWRRVMVILKLRAPNFVSPFLLSYPDFNKSSFAFNINLMRPSRADDLQRLIDGSFKFLFTRDPYHRLFSTYVDKLFAPNSVFWTREARDITRRIRGKENSSESCGQDVTFVEFVRYLNSMQPYNLNEHMIPSSYKCDACRINYDVIGKVETFDADVLYVLKRTGQLGKQIVFHDLKTEYKVDYIVDAVIRAFTLKFINNSGWIHCISSHAGNQRIWRQLQIAGLIDNAMRYPLSPPESKAITVTEFVNMALKALTGSSPSARYQKREAYLQAYDQLTLGDLEALRQTYLKDFFMYDYDDRPDELFNRETQSKHNDVQFDYFDILTLT